MRALLAWIALCVWVLGLVLAAWWPQLVTQMADLWWDGTAPVLSWQEWWPVVVAAVLLIAVQGRRGGDVAYLHRIDMAEDGRRYRLRMTSGSGRIDHHLFVSDVAAVAWSYRRGLAVLAWALPWMAAAAVATVVGHVGWAVVSVVVGVGLLPSGVLGCLRLLLADGRALCLLVPVRRGEAAFLEMLRAGEGRFHHLPALGGHPRRAWLIGRTWIGGAAERRTWPWVRVGLLAVLVTAVTILLREHWSAMAVVPWWSLSGLLVLGSLLCRRRRWQLLLYGGHDGPCLDMIEGRRVLDWAAVVKGRAEAVVRTRRVSTQDVGTAINTAEERAERMSRIRERSRRHVRNANHDETDFPWKETVEPEENE